MFSFFRRKAPTYPSESRWSVLEGEHEGQPLIVRRNESAKSLRGDRRYAHRVGVAIPFREPGVLGLPVESEIAVLNDIEDALADVLEANRDSLQVLAVTTNSMREFVFYTSVPGDIEARIGKTQKRFPSHTLQFYIAEDAMWAGFAQFD